MPPLHFIKLTGHISTSTGKNTHIKEPKVVTRPPHRLFYDSNLPPHHMIILFTSTDKNTNTMRGRRSLNDNQTKYHPIPKF